MRDRAATDLASSGGFTLGRVTCTKPPIEFGRKNHSARPRTSNHSPAIVRSPRRKLINRINRRCLAQALSFRAKRVCGSSACTPDRGSSHRRKFRPGSSCRCGNAVVFSSWPSGSPIHLRTKRDFRAAGTESPERFRLIGRFLIRMYCQNTFGRVR